MAKVQLIGQAVPRGAATINTPGIDFQWQDTERNRVLSFNVRIQHSLINIECEVPNYQSSDFAMVIMRAIDLSRAAVNLIAFSQGIGVQIIFDFAIMPNGNPMPMHYFDARLSQHCSVFQQDAQSAAADYDTLMRILSSEPGVIRLLNDMIEVLWNPHVAPVNCGRVVDGIRRLITPPGTTTEPAAWHNMHSALNLTKDYRKYVMDHSIGPRHGDPTSYIPGPITSDISLRTYIMLNRFLEYRKGGNNRLDATSFPIL